MPEPGTFREPLQGEKPLDSTPLRRRPFEAEVSDTLADMYRKFASKYGNPSNVLYPGCGYDASPSEVFPNVVYVDRKIVYVNALRAKELDARHTTIQDFEPDREFDLLIVMNFHLPDPHPSRLLKRGYAICNHYQSWCLYDNPDFAFIEDLEHPERGFSYRAGYFLFKRKY